MTDNEIKSEITSKTGEVGWALVICFSGLCFMMLTLFTGISCSLDKRFERLENHLEIKWNTEGRYEKTK